MPRAAKGSKGCESKQGDVIAAQVSEELFQAASQQLSYKYIITKILNPGQWFKTKFLLWNMVIFHQQEFARKGWDFFFFNTELNLPLLLLQEL